MLGRQAAVGIAALLLLAGCSKPRGTGAKASCSKGRAVSASAVSSRHPLSGEGARQARNRSYGFRVGGKVLARRIDLGDRVSAGRSWRNSIPSISITRANRSPHSLPRRDQRRVRRRRARAPSRAARAASDQPCGAGPARDGIPGCRQSRRRARGPARTGCEPSRVRHASRRPRRRDHGRRGRSRSGRFRRVSRSCRSRDSRSARFSSRFPSRSWRQSAGDRSRASPSRRSRERSSRDECASIGLGGSRLPHHAARLDLPEAPPWVALGMTASVVPGLARCVIDRGAAHRVVRTAEHLPAQARGYGWSSRTRAT